MKIVRRRFLLIAGATIKGLATLPKAITREQWEAAAKAWNDWGPFLRKWLGSATEIVLDMVGVGPGGRVLDVAAGAQR